MNNQLWAVAEERLGCAGHDMSHVRRVYARAMKLCSHFPECDKEVLSDAVILHDIARLEEDHDPAGRIDHAALGAELSHGILREHGRSEAHIGKVAECIAAHRYRSAGEKPASIEAKILFDADKLDCLGAVGVARMYMLSGQYGEQLYIAPPEDLEMTGHAPRISDFSQYSPNLEYLLKMRFVPARLFTEPAKEIAAVLMARMDRFFEELREELDA